MYKVNRRDGVVSVFSLCCVLGRVWTNLDSFCEIVIVQHGMDSRTPRQPSTFVSETTWQRRDRLFAIFSSLVIHCEKQLLLA